MKEKMLQTDKACRIPSKLVPVCPRCGEAMEVNLRKDAFFVEDKYWHELQQNYDDFIKQYRDKKVVFIELGVGFNTPVLFVFLLRK